MESYLAFGKKLALQAGEIMLKNFRVGLKFKEKEDLSMVTNVDEDINQLVIDAVKETYPDHGVFGEEASHNKSEDLWVCDPLDGTLPFAKGLSISMFSLAYVKDGVPQVGIIYDPFNKRMFTGMRGEGAYMNDKKIEVSRIKLSYQATIDIEWWPEAEYDVDTACHTLSVDTATYVTHIATTVQACALVAAGQYEALVFAGTKGKAVDIAAAKVIVEEAGGKVTDLFGNDQRYDGDIKGAIVSNGEVHEDVVKYIERVTTEK